MERVTHADTVRGRDQRSVRAMLSRFSGGPLEARGVNARDAGALFDQLKASRARLPVWRVTFHECRHDEGVPTCAPDREA